MERLMDLGARRLGLDPAEIRRRNLVRPDEMPYRPGLTYKDGVPIAYDPGDFPSAFERALGLLRYDDWRRRQTAQAGTARRIGLGLACYAQGTGLGPYEGATVRVDPSGKVYVLIGVASQGQGHATTLAQIAASELGAAFEDVVVSAGDTTLFPFGMGTGGSRVMANAGPAVARTAREVRARAALKRRRSWGPSPGAAPPSGAARASWKGSPTTSAASSCPRASWITRPPRPIPPRRSRSPSRRTPRRSTRSASRASARAAPSPAPRRSPMRSKTRSPTSAWWSARSR